MSEDVKMKVAATYGGTTVNQAMDKLAAEVGALTALARADVKAGFTKDHADLATARIGFLQGLIVEWSKFVRTY